MTTHHALTPRQVAVLRLVLEGWTTQDIASSLRISYRTVEAHRSSLMRRLKVHNVAQLMRAAASEGLVTYRERKAAKTLPRTAHSGE